MVETYFATPDSDIVRTGQGNAKDSSFSFSGVGVRVDDALPYVGFAGDLITMSFDAESISGLDGFYRCWS